mmetsp:Transcript_27629/g.62923  ORF Transcript_27629/g.62923 Transcript_27629/m.62923 type:complete len:242 (-) Transcript_27629:655-1380(-)
MVCEVPLSPQSSVGELEARYQSGHWQSMKWWIRLFWVAVSVFETAKAVVEWSWYPSILGYRVGFRSLILVFASLFIAFVYPDEALGRRLGVTKKFVITAVLLTLYFVVRVVSDSDRLHGYLGLASPVTNGGCGSQSLLTVLTTQLAWASAVLCLPFFHGFAMLCVCLLAFYASGFAADLERFQTWTGLSYTFGPTVLVVIVFTVSARRAAILSRLVFLAEQSQRSGRASPVQRRRFPVFPA